MTIQAICEGACNPNIKSADEAVKGFRVAEARESKTGTRAPISDEIAAQLRGLIHTPHSIVSPVAATCQRCGRERKWLSR